MCGCMCVWLCMDAGVCGCVVVWCELCLCVRSECVVMCACVCGCAVCAVCEEWVHVWLYLCVAVCGWV
jgi:hypothetical protein